MYERTRSVWVLYISAKQRKIIEEEQKQLYNAEAGGWFYRTIFAQLCVQLSFI